jgi:hypothetical protein
MSPRLVSAVALVAGFAFAAGCERNARLEVKNSYEIGPQEGKAMILDPQPKPQKFTVEFKADNDINVLVFKDSDIPAGEDGLEKADAKKAIAQKKGKAESFTVDVPEKTGTQIVMREALKKTKVELSVTNRK